jgi:CRP-like cAMP-binding protein
MGCRRRHTGQVTNSKNQQAIEDSHQAIVKLPARRERDRPVQPVRRLAEQQGQGDGIGELTVQRATTTTPPDPLYVVFHRGDPTNALHLIVEGRFAVSIITPLGETTMLGVREPGEAFGDLALVSGGSTERSATVSALEPGESSETILGRSRLLLFPLQVANI